MNKQKQTEEMSNIIAEVAFVQAHEENGDESLSDIVAEAIYNAGYRKVPDGAVTLTKEEQEKHITMTKVNYKSIMRQLNQARKETAKEILQYLYDKCYEIQNIGRGGIAHILPIDILQMAKNYGVEVEE